jgi:serine/threonine-protein kinase RsbW
MTEARRRCEWALSIAPTTAKLADVRKFVEQVAAEAALDQERVFDCKVAVSEACANAVEHATSPVEVVARLSQGRLTFVVTDNGLFRPPTRARDDFNSRGLGMPLMVTLMDEVSFTRTPKGGTRVTLSVWLEKAVKLQSN